MDNSMYVMFIERGKTYNRITRAVVERHVENIRQLDDEGHVAICGAFKGYPGVAGMIVLKARSLEEADALCQREPLVAEGYATYKLRVLMVGTRENNYLL